MLLYQWMIQLQSPLPILACHYNCRYQLPHNCKSNLHAKQQTKDKKITFIVDRKIKKYKILFISGWDNGIRSNKVLRIPMCLRTIHIEFVTVSCKMCIASAILPSLAYGLEFYLAPKVMCDHFSLSIVMLRCLSLLIEIEDD